MTQSDFSDKVVCVIGAGGGIGSAIASVFLESGANLALVYRNNSVPEKFRNCLCFKGDISESGFVADVFKSIIDKRGRIDVVINTAAILGPIAPLPETDIFLWKKTIDTNLFGTYLVMRECLQYMIPVKRGKIINFAGGGAAYSYPNFTAYACSKAAAVRLTETAADEVAMHNIQINIIAPGAVETPMLEQVRNSGGEIKNIVSMDKPVNLVMFLASDKADHITGRFIHSLDDYESLSVDFNKDLYKLRRLPK